MHGVIDDTPNTRHRRPSPDTTLAGTEGMP